MQPNQVITLKMLAVDLPVVFFLLPVQNLFRPLLYVVISPLSYVVISSLKFSRSFEAYSVAVAGWRLGDSYIKSIGILARLQYMRKNVE